MPTARCAVPRRRVSPHRYRQERSPTTELDGAGARRVAGLKLGAAQSLGNPRAGGGTPVTSDIRLNIRLCACRAAVPAMTPFTLEGGAPTER